MRNVNFFIAGFFLFIATGCKQSESKLSTADSIAANTLHISVDESFEPVISEELKVFRAAYPTTIVKAEYKPEAECLRDLEKDSTKVIIISRELSREETKFFNEKITYKPEFDKIAKDAIAVILNENASDSAFTMNEVRDLLSGKSSKNLQVAIDGNTATSTVRYLKDSVLNGGQFGKNVTGAKGTADLINYIATTKNAIGFAGISWLTNPQTAEQEKALEHVRMGLIECGNCDKGVFAKPSQQTITFGQYPLVRGLYYVLKENYAGLGSRFVQFLTTERGQLIFRRALLVPVKMRFNRRVTNIEESE